MSGGTRRSSTEITLEMLQVVMNGENRPTRIMYECNLSYQTCKSKLEELVINGLVKEHDSNGRKVYEITPKGIEMIENLYQLKILLDL